MIRPVAGLQAFHDGTPFEFLHLVSHVEGQGEIWRVRPTFVEGPDRDRLIGPHDRLTPIHSAVAPARRLNP